MNCPEYIGIQANQLIVCHKPTVAGLVYGCFGIILSQTAHPVRALIHEPIHFQSRPASHWSGKPFQVPSDPDQLWTKISICYWSARSLSWAWSSNAIVGLTKCPPDFDSLKATLRLISQRRKHPGCSPRAHWDWAIRHGSAWEDCPHVWGNIRSLQRGEERENPAPRGIRGRSGSRKEPRRTQRFRSNSSAPVQGGLISWRCGKPWIWSMEM